MRASTKRSTTSSPPIREENSVLIDRAIKIAGQISGEFELLVSSGRITFDDLFDNNYVPIARHRSGAIQHAVPFLCWSRSLPPIQNPHYDANPNMTLCSAIDRNGYIPVHRPTHSQPQRAGEPTWNERNCRNRRIYNDPMRLTARAARVPTPSSNSVTPAMATCVDPLGRGADPRVRQALGRDPHHLSGLMLR